MPQEIPEIEESTKFNFITSIWIVPFIAVMIAGWLAYQYYDQLGPEIRIVFPENVGLQAGQSHIKYRDVPVGTVKRIELEESGSGVVVVARMDKTATPYLNEYTKFWIVKPEVGIGGVSGLDTLISGTYIEMYAQKGGTYKEKFVGLEHAYRNIGGGEHFVLNTPKGESAVKVGTPLYLKNVKVGQVEYVVLSLDGTSVDVIVFIDKSYVPYVHTDSKFWVRSTLEVGLANGSLDVKIAPVTDLIQGAIEFSSTGRDKKMQIPDNFVFRLYKNKNVIESKKVGYGGKFVKRFLIRTQDSIAKLKQHALVRYDGFEVGKVNKIKLNYDRKTHKMEGKVVIELDTSVFEDPDDANHSSGERNFYQAVREGLRAQIVPSDPISGMLYVDLTFEHNDSSRTIIEEKGIAVLPSIPYHGNSIMAGINRIVEKVNALQLESLIAALTKTVEESRQPIAHADEVLVSLKKSIDDLHSVTSKRSFKTMPDEIDKTLKELTHTLRTAKKLMRGYGSNSLVTHQITATLKAVKKTSEEMQEFLRMLNRKPNSLIFGDQ
jgi:paraquat-inducible protein B